MNDRIFIDTNVLVYLFDNDSPDKQKRAEEILSDSSKRGKISISTQVIQEFYVVVTKKLDRPLAPDQAYKAVQEISSFSVVQIDTELIFFAIQMSQNNKISFWDSLIIQSAISGGAKKLYSEDLQQGRSFGNLEIENPFL